ncbi:DUF3519 domain-containing protein [Helicobacter pylori]|uniref:putative barnase/colicin E5 family endoribonuclease n=1 Tax=Helicobacter pylori TaxID=210 RepID=UPI00095C3FC4|nr:DUF3519 domain-containing protein [Helicobacter pylori]OJZ93419.1 hypothetical protein AP069_0206150 [Helicobacter pylori]OKB27574.1 hypothetical protein AP070_0206550 [Helicobacter pylori]
MKPKEALEKLLQERNGQVAGAALKYHIKRALERSHSISDFSKNLELSAKNSQFTNNTLKIIEELNNSVKQASEELKEATKPSNLVKSIREQDTRPFEVIQDKEAFFKDLNQNLEANATVLPKGMSVEEFKKSLESVENKERFLKHLETRDNSDERLAALNLVEPILREPHIEIFTKDNAIDKKEYIKAFKDEKQARLYMLITQDNDKILRSFIPDTPERYVRNHVRNADIIHSFIQPNRTAKSDNALSDVVVYGENTTKKPLTSQEELLKTQENALKTQENLPKTTQTPLSPLEQANAEKLAKLESERLESEKEFTRLKEQETKRKEALKKKLEHERGNAGNIESATKIEVGEDIPMLSQAQIPKSRVRLNEREIYDLNYAIVKAKDLKPSFTTGGTQKRTDMNEEQIKSIAQNFDPKKIFGSGGFEDLPIILHDGQVIAGNHRVAGMLNFTPKSRFAYEKAIKEYYHINLKPDELLVRIPNKRLNNTEINNLAASSNQGRFNSESDHAIAVLSHYEPKLKELEKQLNADSVYSLKNMVAKNLNFDKATHPNAGDSNLALLMFNMPRTKTQGIELLNRWQKEFSNDSKSYEKVKKMFVDNAGSFHNLIHDMSFPNVSLNAYLSDIMDRSFANLKNYPSTSDSLKDLSEKFYKTNSLDIFEKSDQAVSDISEILGASVARFARFDDPSKALFEALKSDNIKKGLKEFKIADVTKDMFDPNSKEFKDIDIYDFTHYLLMVGREPNENNPTLNRLIEAVKGMQKESEKTIKKPKLETPSEWGYNYSEFKGDGLGAINKLLETKKGFVAGAFHKEGLGDIDLVWGNKDYGLEHILKRRESDAIDKGMSKEEAKKYALEIINNIPHIISNGKLSKDGLGRLKIEFKNQRVGLNDSWKGETLNNRWVITSYELNPSRNGLIESPLAPNYKGKDTNPLNLDNSNHITNAHKTQEPLSEQANAKKLAKLETKKAIKAEALKKLHFDEIKKLIDESPRTGSSMPILGMQNLNAEAVEYIQKNHKRIAVEKIEPSFAKDLKLKYPDDARAVIDYQAINHILKEHKNLSFEDIANYRELSKQANETLKLKDNQNRPVVASFNQINGFFVVVEQVSNAKNELMLKTIYKARGNYKDSLIYKRTLAKSQNSN